MTDPLPRLYVLPPSHFCERARWALDHAGIAYEEERWAVGPHAERARRIAPGSSLPILDTGRQVIQGSDAILDWCAMPGGDPELERRFVERIGPLVRRFLYAGLLNDPDGHVLDLLLDGVAPAEAALARPTWPATRQVMIARMGAEAWRLPSLATEVAEVLGWFGRHLDGRSYLSGDGFGRAELTAASLLAPLARPDVSPLYGRIRMPDDIQSALTQWAEAPALAWVGRIYRRHRLAHVA